MRFDRFAGAAGVYLLRDANKEPLYVGETTNLGRRLAAHAASRGLGRRVTQVALLTEDDLPSGEYRLPLWVDLVRRYTPAMNVVIAKQDG